MVVLGLAKSKRPEASDVLVDLLDDPGVSEHATDAFRKRPTPRAREGLERMTTDSRAWERRSAKGALQKLTPWRLAPDVDRAEAPLLAMTSDFAIRRGRRSSV